MLDVERKPTQADDEQAPCEIQHSLHQLSRAEPRNDVRLWDPIPITAVSSRPSSPTRNSSAPSLHLPCFT